ncbi:hypothetical protein GCM10022240_22560 [Microbacterium kribbense]|uniref:Acetone carboxylase n=1 Tax=Microbacterium kribbense TaxID=433645 RepID=A0ABP7GT03_9MICO
MSLPFSSPDAAEEPICSRAGCREPATMQVVWRNPRIHSADRRKIWLACDDHVGFLREYLASRAFPVAVEPFLPPPAAVPTEEPE